MANSYTDLTYEKLRELLLNGELEHERMSESDYEFLLDNEVEFGDCNETVLDFCTDGLKRFEKYKECLDLSSKNKKVTIVVHRKLKRFFIAIAAVAVSFSLIIVTVSAMGYDVIGLIRKALNSPERSATDNRGDGVILSDDIRVYNSMSEMLESENLNILYLAELPRGYKFTDFRITDFGSRLVLGAYASEPYISFEVRIGENRQIENYEYELNGIKYNITKDDGTYHAEWIFNSDYYTIVVNDKETISEIIENLKER